MLVLDIFHTTACEQTYCERLVQWSRWSGGRLYACTLKSALYGYRYRSPTEDDIKSLEYTLVLSGVRYR